MRILKWILGLVFGVIALAFIASMVMPKDIKLEREITINRPVEEVFEFAQYVGNMDKVSVWQSKDPNIKKTTRGTDGQVGFVSRWEGNKEVGVGEQEIKNIVPNQRIDSELRFEKPFQSTDQAYLITESAGDNKTIVKWGFESKLKPPMNLMNGSIKKSLSKDFDQGLENLKNELEK